MKIATITKPTLAALINDRLARLGANGIPSSAREIIEGQITQAVTTLVERRVTAPLVGRAVATALAKKTTKNDADDRQMSLFIEENKA